MSSSGSTKNKPPVYTVEGAQAHEQYLLQHRDEYSIEFYGEDEFEIRGATLVITKD